AEDNRGINCFQKFGEGPISTELVKGELPPPGQGFGVVRVLLYSRVYCLTVPTTPPALRWELFRSKNFAGEMLLPIRAASIPHITSVNDIVMRDKSYPPNRPALPSIEQQG
ncbi:MAG: hypothetical protein M3H12_17980, partial [Chromatiales bacterium]